MPNAIKRTLEEIDNNNNDVHNEVSIIDENEIKQPSAKRQKSLLKVQFDTVNVFYFDRQQGFSCIPNSGTTTIGMSFNHTHHESYKIDDYLTYKRKVHLDIIEKNKTIKKLLIRNLKFQNDDASDEEIDDIDNYDLTNDIALLDTNLDLPINTELFCPILTPAERQRIIKHNSDSIDESESKDIALVRKSREECGCSCKDVCEEDTCLCIINGIGCQLDKTRFPCSCSARRCKNQYGLKRFDLRSVRKHYDCVLYHQYYELNYKQNNENNEVDNNKNEKLAKNVKKRGRKSKRRKPSNNNKKNNSSNKKIIKNTTSSDDDNSNNNYEKSNNNCQDLLPYEPFDLFKNILVDNRREISV